MKFSIRDVMWFTVVVALVLGWWVDRGRLRAIYSEEVRRSVDATDEAEDVAVQLRAELELLKKSQSALPNTSAPAPTPPKP